MTDDTKAINAAILDAHQRGVRVVKFPPTGQGFVLKRHTTNVQRGGIRLLPGVSLEGEGTKLILKDNASFIDGVSRVSAPVTITQDVAATDTTLTLSAVDTTINSDPYGEGTASQIAFKPGQMVFIRLNTIPGNYLECGDYGFAKVIAVDAANKRITIDKSIGAEMRVATEMSHETTHSLPAGQNRSVSILEEVLEDFTISGFHLESDAISANSEHGVNLQFARRFHISDISGRNTGAGLVAVQFAEDGLIENVRSLGAVDQDQVGTKGFGFYLGESRGITLKNIYAENFEHGALVAEANNRQIAIDGFEILNNYPSPPEYMNVLLGQNSDVAITNLLMRGEGRPNQSVNGINLVYNFGDPTSDYVEPSHRITVTNATLSFDSLPVWSGPLHNFNPPLTIGPNTYTSVHRRFFAAPIAANQSDAVAFSLPPTLIRDARVCISSKTGITSMRTVNDLGRATTLFFPPQNFDSLPPVGTWGDADEMSVFGYPYPDNPDPAATARYVLYSSDVSVPAGTYMNLQFEYFVSDADPKVLSWEAANPPQAMAPLGGCGADPNPIAP